MLWFGSVWPESVTSIFKPVSTRKIPKRYRIQWNLAIRAAPTRIITPRRTRAPITPQNSTRCWYIRGTAKKLNSMAITKMLSTLSDFLST